MGQARQPLAVAAIALAIAVAYTYRLRLLKDLRAKVAAAPEIKNGYEAVAPTGWRYQKDDPQSGKPVVRVEDQYGNLRSADNSTVVTASRSGGSGTLQGTTNLTAVNGIVTRCDTAGRGKTPRPVGPTPHRERTARMRRTA